MTGGVVATEANAATVVQPSTDSRMLRQQVMLQAIHPLLPLSQPEPVAGTDASETKV